MGEDREERLLACALQASLSPFLRRLRQVTVRGELTMPEVSALARLDRAGSSTASALARAEGISPQAMGLTLLSLEQRGLVERRPDPADGRRVVACLTEAGVRALRNEHSAWADQVSKAFATGEFTRAELRALTAAAPLLERLSRSL
ncbi:MarR family transcriptional regulator [Streptomyces sp. NPDC088194]|uniref:MarR family winged helix-turn-helix transcriptional regulator n=1 Tax=Streptomyces sp. NPDC088194 TaxID=3154931 RepID=UPI00344BC860